MALSLHLFNAQHSSYKYLAFNGQRIRKISFCFSCFCCVSYSIKKRKKKKRKTEKGSFQCYSANCLVEKKEMNTFVVQDFNFDFSTKAQNCFALKILIYCILFLEYIWITNLPNAQVLYIYTPFTYTLYVYPVPCTFSSISIHWVELLNFYQIVKARQSSIGFHLFYYHYYYYSFSIFWILPIFSAWRSFRQANAIEWNGRK